MPSPSPFLFPSPTPTPVGFGSPPELVVWPYLLQLVVFTAVLAAVALYGLRYLRDKFPGLNLGIGVASATGLRVVDRVTVDAKRSVFVVALGKRAWLLAATDHQVTPIAEIDPAELGNQFASLVEKESQRRDAP